MAGVTERGGPGVHYWRPSAWRKPERVSPARAEAARWPDRLSKVGAAETNTSRALVPPRVPVEQSRWLRLRPPTVARALTMVAMTLHALAFGIGAPFGRSIAGGALLMGAGFAWMAWAWWCFREARTPLPPTARPTMLIDDGPYRFGRNPMYLGMVAMMLGMGLATGVPFMAIAALNFVVIVATVHVPHEEAQMRRVFGGWYSDYAATVRRWL
jgi:protein-S-isoprenylcysteine O-methyltransferase Ste14